VSPQESCLNLFVNLTFQV